MGYDATHVYAEEWKLKLQERLTEPTKFQRIARVEYTNSKVLHNPYLTETYVSSLSRGTPYTMHPVTETDESITISTGGVVPQFIDRADLAQSTFLSQMELADKQGVLLNEYVESALYANYGNRTDFGATDVTNTGAADSTAITISDTNIDNVIGAVKRVIRTAGGEGLMDRNGLAFVWRPSDLEILERFCAANGFAFADEVLVNGLKQGVRAMGAIHFSSNLLTAGHVWAGVMGLEHIGILKATYGDVVITQDPALTSGIGIVSRVDFAVKAWNNTKPILFDVNVA